MFLLYDITHMWNLKQTNWWTQQKRNRLTDIEDKPMATSGEREVGKGNTEAGDQEVQTIIYKISYKDCFLCESVSVL